MESANPDMGEQAISKVAAAGIKSQLDEADTLEVDLRTDPGKLIQGKLDSVSVSGHGLVMKQDLRVEDLTINAGEVSINPLSAVFGKIELTRSTDAEAQIVLTETDLNRALSSGFIQDKLQNLEMQLDGKPEKLNVQNVSVALPGDNQFVIHAKFTIGQSDETKALSAVAIPTVEAAGNRISLELVSTEGHGIDEDLMNLIFEQIEAMLDLRNIDIPGMTLTLERLDAQKERFVIHGTTLIESFPSE